MKTSLVLQSKFWTWNIVRWFWASLNPLLSISLISSAQNKSESSGTKPGTRALGNQVIRKGHMCIQNLGIMKGNTELFPASSSITINYRSNICRWLSPILVRIDLGEYILVQRWGRKGEEIHVTIGRFEIARHRTRLYVASPHIRALQSRWPKCLQRLQAIGIVMRKCGRCWFLESLIPSRRRLSRKRSANRQ